MDVYVKSLEGKSIVAEHFDKKKEAQNWISVSNTSDGIILPENKSLQYDASENYPCVLEYEDQENNSGEIVFDNHQAIGCKTANYSEACVNEAKQMSMVSSSTVSNSSHVSAEIKGLETVNSRTNPENTVSILDVTGKPSNSGCEITNETERINKILVTNSETNDGLTICTIETDELLITCEEAVETSSSELSKRICPNSVMKNENRLNTDGNQLLKIIYEIEMFFDAVNSTNKDMKKKSGILLQKQNLVDEIISYIQAVQSVNRLSTFRNLFTGNLRKDSMVVYHNKSLNKNSKQTSKASKTFYEAANSFYEAGEKILEELDLYRTELREDFKVWEAYRKEIVEISDQMLDDFEYCEDEMSAKVLMHEISTRMCDILRHMEMITSRRENKNENCIDLMDSVDTYIRYSSAFIMGNRTLHYS